MRVKTVTIKHNDAPLIINEADFREGSDELWEESEVETEGAVGDEGLPANETDDIKPEIKNDVQVKHKGGGRWIVLVNDVQAHDGTLTKVEAQALAAEY